LSKYTTYYTSRQQMFKDLAVNWITQSDSMNLSEEQRRGMKLFFKPIARRFGLVKEFREIGVI
jgi:hypothetical protein